MMGSGWLRHTGLEATQLKFSCNRNCAHPFAQKALHSIRRHFGACTPWPHLRPDRGRRKVISEPPGSAFPRGPIMGIPPAPSILWGGRRRRAVLGATLAVQAARH